MGRAQHRVVRDDVSRLGDWGPVVAAGALGPDDQLAVATVLRAKAVGDGHGAAVLVEGGRAVLVPEDVLAECVTLVHGYIIHRDDGFVNPLIRKTFRDPQRGAGGTRTLPRGTVATALAGGPRAAPSPQTQRPASR